MNQSIGFNLIKYRTESHFSKADIAKYLEIQSTLYNSYESGDKDISAYQLKRLADLFYVSM